MADSFRRFLDDNGKIVIYMNAGIFHVWLSMRLQLDRTFFFFFFKF